MYCEQCGKENKPGARFCTECGAEIKANHSDLHIENRKPRRFRIAVVFLLLLLILIVSSLVGQSIDKKFIRIVKDREFQNLLETTMDSRFELPEDIKDFGDILNKKYFEEIEWQVEKAKATDEYKKQYFVTFHGKPKDDSFGPIVTLFQIVKNEDNKWTVLVAEFGTGDVYFSANGEGLEGMDIFERYMIVENNFELTAWWLTEEE